MDKKDPLASLSARLASMTSERADVIECGEASLDEDLDLRIAGAAPDLSDAPPELVHPVHPPGGVNVRGIRAKFNLTQRNAA